jgi:hypothetical protein
MNTDHGQSCEFPEVPGNDRNSHADLVQIAVRWLRRARRCCVVLAERGSVEIPDAIGWSGRGASVVVECKVSVADYRADLQKPHRRDLIGMGAERWYLTPAGLLAGLSPLEPWGLLEWDGARVRIRRKATSVDANVIAERRLLLNELRAYHAQGISYARGTERWGARR